MSLTAETSSVAESRRAILAEIGDPPDLTFVRSVGNVGDHLIWAGTRALLADRIYTETTLEGLCGAHGHTVLLAGGGAFCRPYHHVMPRALAVAEMRFERVVLLPSSFDPSEDTVREALALTRATVFARERESYRRIRPLCDARIAHDGAFFFDYTPYQRPGVGTLNAFRTDREALDTAGAPLPATNDDISVTAPNLEAWLAIIAAHRRVRTDRAHVMIAAALLGKEVEYGPTTYHKVSAIAEYALADHPVRPIRSPGEGDGNRPVPARGRVRRDRRPVAERERVDSQLTAIVLTRDQPQRALAAIDSIRAGEATPHVLVIDNNSGHRAARELAEGCAARERVTVRHSDRNLGCAGGRKLGVELTAGELVLFLDDDAEFEPGAVDLLYAEMRAHPGAAAVTATVIFPDGSTHHSGGWLRISRAAAQFGLIGYGSAVQDLPPSGPADWVAGTAAMIRRDVLQRFPIDAGMRAYCEDNEWCYRVETAAPGSFRRLLEARAVHHFAPKLTGGRDFESRSVAIKRLESFAWFYGRHGKLLLDDLFAVVPELNYPGNDTTLHAARLLLELVLARGADWTFSEWLNGGLDVLLKAPGRVAALQAELGPLQAELERQTTEHAHWSEQITHVQDEHATLQDEQARLQAAHATLRDQHARLQSAHARLEQELPALRISDATLARILDGGWWRARGRMLPALELYARLRGHVER